MKKNNSIKKCTYCHKTKPITEFYSDTRSKDGHRSDCKKCVLTKRKETNKLFPERKILHNLKNRCNNENVKEYKWYGKKGVKSLITEDEIRQLMIRDGYWDMKRPSIDRIDNDGDYTYENCQFIEMDINRIKNRGKPILQFDLEGNFIREWESIIEAERELNYSHQFLGKCCKGINKTAYGFMWRYKNEEKK